MFYACIKKYFGTGRSKGAFRQFYETFIMHVKVAVLHVLCMLFCVVVGVDILSELNCSIARTDGYIILDDTEQTLNVSVLGEKVWCDENFTCLTEYTENQTIPQQYVKQRSPVTIHDGIQIRLTIPGEMHVDSFTVYQTDRDGLVGCNVDNGSTVINGSGDGWIVSKDYLQIGMNYLVFVAKNDSTYNCLDGDRLAIIVKKNECNSNNTPVCSNRGLCSTTTKLDSYSCSCCHGYSGRHCEQDDHHVTATCESIECQNGGTCVDFANDIDDANSTHVTNTTRCECKPYFTGTFCETRLDSCKSNPCQRGVCVERPPSYQCYCVPGFHGSQCEQEYNECISNPCVNGGTCVDKLDKYTCVCTDGHTGINCETNVDFCEPNPCHFNSTCVNQERSFTCSCPKGLTGHTCESQINECASNPCQNEGTCVDLKNGFECICPITFAGIHCEYMMDVFAPPIEGSEVDGNNHSHNLYVVAGTLSGAILLVLVVLIACYCKMHETYRQLTWRRMRYKKRSLSCPDLESYGGAATTNKHRLSVDAIWEATSLCYDNASYDNSAQQPIVSQRI